VQIADSIREDIAQMVRALPSADLLALVGDQLAGLVAEHGAAALAPPAPVVTCPEAPPRRPRPAALAPEPVAAPAPPPAPTPGVPSSPAKPRRSRTTPESFKALTGARFPTCAPWKNTDPFLPWPREIGGVAVGVDLAAPGKQCATIAEDVRRIVLKRHAATAEAAALDPDDLVQDVYRRIMRRNYRPSAFDPRRASLSTYVYRVAGNAISDAMTAARTRAGHELHRGAPGGEDGYDEDRDLAHADQSDPLAALEDVDAAADAGLDVAASREAGELIWKTAEAAEVGKLIWKGSGPDEEPRPEVDVFTPLDSDAEEAAKVERALERAAARARGAADVTPEPLRQPVTPLWKLALEQRQAEQAREHGEREQVENTAPPPGAGGELDEKRSAAAKKREGDIERGARLDREIGEYIAAESAERRPVTIAALVGMLGETRQTVRNSLGRLVELGAIEGKGRRGGGFWALARTEATDPPEVGQYSKTAPVDRPVPSDSADMAPEPGPPSIAPQAPAEASPGAEQGAAPAGEQEPRRARRGGRQRVSAAAKAEHVEKALERAAAKVSSEDGDEETPAPVAPALEPCPEIISELARCDEDAGPPTVRDAAPPVFEVDAREDESGAAPLVGVPPAELDPALDPALTPAQRRRLIALRAPRMRIAVGGFASLLATPGRVP
jgi:DNA-directed RNA polymerase specialized sigma24 family protein